MRNLFLQLLILFCALPAFALTPQDQYIDYTTGCGGNDGTVGNPYCTCSEWEAQNTDLVSADKVLTVHSTGTDTGGCTVAGWATSPTQRIIIDGLTMVSGNYGVAFLISNNNVTLRNSDISKNGPGTTKLVFDVDYGVTGFIIERNKFHMGASWTNDAGTEFVRLRPGTSGAFRNNFIYDFPNLTASMNFSIAASQTLDINNNTFVAPSGNYGIYQDIDSTPTGTVVNFNNNICVGAGGGIDCVRFSTGAATFNHAKNITNDASSPDASFRNKTITFVNAGAKNFHLDPGETDAIDQGDTIGSFANDYDGDSRPQGVAWDIGADEVASAGPLVGSLTTLKVSGAH